MSDFSLDRTENPHPQMLDQALLARSNARLAEDRHGEASLDWRNYWRGYLRAMCDATGESSEAIEAWLDRHEV